VTGYYVSGDYLVDLMIEAAYNIPHLPIISTVKFVGMFAAEGVGGFGLECSFVVRVPVCGVCVV
jgi:hypothetical protein